jgi:hypothetical protein
MDYLDWMLLKAGVVLLGAFVWGFFCGKNGLELNGQPQDTEHRDTSAAPRQGQASE